MRILIAEDDVTSRNMLALVLRKGGHEVVPTVDGAAACAALLQPDAPKIAILDWMMPEMDGPEVVRRVRAIETSQPPYLILLTTKAETTDIIAGLESGANDYLTKPFDPRELRARVDVGRRLVDTQAILAAKVEELRQALDNIKTLRGLVPICAQCKQIRDDKGFWSQVETYVTRHSEATFSHSLCPTCITTLYPDLAEDDEASPETSVPTP
jgi:DNA-binding response OmpR family regulator